MLQLDDLFKCGVTSEVSANKKLPSRAHQIFVLIQNLVERAASIRRQEQLSTNDEWFSAESQIKIRQQV